MTTELKAFHVGLFVSGLIIGVTTTWLSLAWRKVSPPVIVAPPQQQDAEKEPAKEEEEEEDEEYDSDEDLSESEENEAEANPHKLLLIVRNDLKMGKGKIAAQCSHATLAAYKTAKKQNPKALRYWSHHGQAKVVVKVKDEAQMDAIREAAKQAGIITSVIADAGRTQIAAGSRTVLALGPAPVPQIDAVAGHLSLY